MRPSRDEAGRPRVAGRSRVANDSVRTIALLRCPIVSAPELTSKNPLGNDLVRGLLEPRFGDPERSLLASPATTRRENDRPPCKRTHVGTVRAERTLASTRILGGAESDRGAGCHTETIRRSRINSRT